MKITRGITKEFAEAFKKSELYTLLVEHMKAVGIEM